MAAEPIRTYVHCDNGETFAIDTIEHEGDLWLVPKWLGTPYPGMLKPARIIRMAKQQLQFLSKNFLGSGLTIYKLDGLVPRAALDGASASLPDQPLDVIEAPDLAIRRS